LNIPAHLQDRTVNGIRPAYVKYLAYLDAKNALDKAMAEGKWLLPKAPTHEEIVDVFISKSAFFKNYKPYFPYVQNYPTLHRWLKNDEDDVPSDKEAWGVTKDVYMFRDLKDFFKRANEKEKEEEKGKGKGKGKEIGEGSSQKKSAGKKKATKV
jgi:hypothetical protein